MKIILLSSVLVALNIFLGMFVSFASAHGEWGYHNSRYGPERWGMLFPLCDGNAQSPINLETLTTIPIRTAKPLSSIHYSKKYSGTISQNGHNIMLSFPGTAKELPRISGLGFPSGSVFEFAQLHFHWGSSDNSGSEHTLDGQKLPGEVHLVHWNRKYGNISQALMQKDGLGVLGYFIQLSEEDNPNFSSITGKIKDLENENGVEVGLLSLSSLIHGPLNSDYFYYQGSLTTPACTENVFWTVFTSPIYLSESQLDAFRGLFKLEGHSISDNNRPVQPRNGREVFLYQADQVV